MQLASINRDPEKILEMQRAVAELCTLRAGLGREADARLGTAIRDGLVLERTACAFRNLSLAIGDTARSVADPLVARRLEEGHIAVICAFDALSPDMRVALSAEVGHRLAEGAGPEKGPEMLLAILMVRVEHFPKAPVIDLAAFRAARTAERSSRRKT